MKSWMIFFIFLFSCSKGVILPPKDVLETTKKYDRHEWKHWIDVDKDCQNTRQEILITRSEISVGLNKRGCSVKTGQWKDYYYPQTFTKSSDIDVDHLIPLKNAFETGGGEWGRKEKETFANDPENLVLTSKKYNRSKGAKGIDAWLPVDQEYACKYIKDWVKIKQKYQLHLTAAEKNTLVTIKEKCPGLERHY